MVSGYYQNFISGTITANGTLSQEYDLGEHAHAIGLYASGLSTGTLEFLVALQPLALGGTYTNLRKLDATKVVTGSVSGTVAFGGDALAPIAPYRYVQIIASASQTNGPTLTFVVKG